MIDSEIWNIDTLDEINRISGILHQRRDELVRRMTMTINVGANVYFIHSKDGRKICGTVTKINQKTVKLLTDTGVRWTVSSSLIHPQVSQPKENIADNIQDALKMMH